MTPTATRESFSIPAPRFARGLSRAETVLAEGAFLVLLLLVFVGMTPFAPPPPVEPMGLPPGPQSGAGDAMRQLLFLGVFGSLLYCSARRRGAALIQTVPVLLAGLLFWCVASSLWTPEPGITLRRAGLAVILAVSCFLGVDTVGPKRALAMIRGLFLALLAVNVLSIPLIAVARHLPGEADPALVGNWRGLYGHKNIAGAWAAITAMLFFFSALDRKSPRDAAIAAAAVFFLLQTHSKSSLGLLPPALLAGLVYRIGWRNALDRGIVLACAGIMAVIAVTLFLADYDTIARMFSDPAEFTGRAAIWQAEIAYFQAHPVLGAGFGTFSDTGGVSPIAGYGNNMWVREASHGHNGYLQILVTIGGVGFVLAMLALLVAPAAGFWRRDGRDKDMAMLFGLFVFFVSHNMMESDFLEGGGVAWSMFLLTLALLRATPPVPRRAR